MSGGRSSAPPAVVLIIFAVILFFIGRTAWQWFSADGPDPSRPLAEQVGAIPGVVDVRVESGAVPGAGSHRGAESWVTFDDRVLADPQASAEALAGVSHGWSRSHWSFEGMGSSAEVHYVSSVDPAPFAWWLQGVAALQQDVPGADLACDIRSGSLDCAVSGGDAERARHTLTGIDGAPVSAWLDAARPDPDQPHGFVLRVGGEEITDLGG